MASSLDCQFSIQNLNELAYELTVQFPKGKTNGSTRTFVFKRELDVKEGRVFDVFTKNASCSHNPLQGLIKSCDIEDAVSAAQTLITLKSDGDTSLAVFDFKDSENGYLPLTTHIQDAEHAVCEVFQGPKVTQKNLELIQRLFKGQLKVKYLLGEGGLKQDLLKNGGFSFEEIGYLNSQPGSGAFCQLTEFFMHSLKLGETPCGGGQEPFEFGKYIKPLGSSPYKPVALSTVFYPKCYKKIYSLDSPVATAMRSVFQLTGGFQTQSKITLWDLKRK